MTDLPKTPGPERAILAAMDQAVYVIRASDGTIVYTTPAFERMFGYGPDEMVGRPVSIVNAPTLGDPEETAARIRADLETHGVWRGEVHNVRKDGTTFWSWAAVTPLLASGAEAAWVAVHTDITERKQRETELEAVYRVPTALAIVAKTDDGMIVRVSEGAMGILGYAPDEMMGRPFFDFIHPDDLSGSASEAAQISDGKVTQSFENRYRHKDGNRYRSLAWAVSVDPETGLAYGLAQDITERKQDELVLKDANAALEERVAERTRELEERHEDLVREVEERRLVEARLSKLLEDREVLLREIHHRVKNNLQIISSLLSLQAGVLANADARDAFLESRSRVRTMALLHEHLYQSADVSSVRADEYVRNLVDYLAGTYQVKARSIRIDVEVDAQALSLDLMIPLGLIVNEIVTNSFKHAFPDGRAGSVTIRLERIGADFRLEVEDDGVGFGDGEGFAVPGRLGRRLVDGLVGQLGGAAEVQSSQGVRYRITFPAGD